MSPVLGRYKVLNCVKQKDLDKEKVLHPHGVWSRHSTFERGPGSLVSDPTDAADGG